VKGPTSARERELALIYAAVPRVACKRLCEASCGPITLTAAERVGVRRSLGRDPPEPLFDPADPSLRCRLLTTEGACSAYVARPLVCRLWGASDGMPCPWRCEVIPRALTELEARALLHRLQALSPDWEPRARELVRQIAEALGRS
jgi:uncharacterized protein